MQGPYSVPRRGALRCLRVASGAGVAPPDGMRTVTELIAHLWDDECPTAPVEAVIDEFREESPTTERPRTRRKETLDERTLVFRVNR